MIEPTQKFYDSQKRVLLKYIAELDSPEPATRYLARLHVEMGMRTGFYPGGTPHDWFGLWKPIARYSHCNPDGGSSC